METSIVVALVGILGVIVGASFQYFFNRKIESAKQFQLLRTQAYVDFVKGWSGMGRSQFFGDKEKEIEYTILTSEAKARVSIYGSEKVVRKFAEFIQQYNETVSEKGADNFSELIQMMRKESVGIEDCITKSEIANIVVGNVSEEVKKRDTNLC